MKNVSAVLGAAFLMAALWTGSAEAQLYGSSGNTYSRSGSTVYGNNFNTGSSWSNSYSLGGNQQGIDSRGNSWSYNRSSGSYYNYGTGEMRIRGRRY